MGIAKKVLTPEELSENQAIQDEARQWIDVLMRFSIKESIYKALDPFVKRYVGFDEAHVRPELDGTANIRLSLKNKEGPFWAMGRYEWFHGHLITSVRLGESPRLESSGSA